MKKIQIDFIDMLILILCILGIADNLCTRYINPMISMGVAVLCGLTLVILWTAGYKKRDRK